jgi:hypothetical protein
MKHLVLTVERMWKTLALSPFPLRGVEGVENQTPSSTANPQTLGVGKRGAGQAFAVSYGGVSHVSTPPTTTAVFLNQKRVRTISPWRSLSNTHLRESP